MAKRKRLSPANPSVPLSPAPRPAFAPIAQVAGEAAATSALTEVTEALESARSEGRMIESLALEAVDATHLVRDRIALDDEEQETLKRSLVARGQQMPIEVVALEAGYGLVSGWRRLSALKALYAETGEARFATVLARVVTPEDRAGAYVAMVEENEIRAGLSFYERARIVWKAEADGIYPTRRAALQGLFGAVPRAKRSKIGSFVVLVEAFDGALRFPTAISEKLGLRLVKALAGDPGLARRLCQRLRSETPEDAEGELAILSNALKPAAETGAPASAAGAALQVGDEALGLRFDARRGQIVITGADAALYAELKGWLDAR
jgi:hypothetical protein